MNIHTEQLENHTARLTVEVEPERLQKAMQDAARRISKKGRIPGFRPGKAPMSVVVNLYGREYVLGEAIDKLGNDIYREALDASKIDPYAPGTLEDVKEEDGLKLIFVVPLRPTVDLGDYREIRAEYEVQEVTDETVTEAMESLRQEQALLEDVERPAKMGDQVTFSHIEVVVLLDEDDEDDDEDDEDDASGDEDEEIAEPSVESDESEEDDEEDEEDEDADEDEDDEDEEDEDGDDGERVLIHQHDYDRVLRDDKDDLFPGFAAEIVGLNLGQEKTFELDISEDFDEKEIAGRTLRCEVAVSKVQARTVPEWTDDLAKRITEDRIETMIELRMDMRKRLEEYAVQVAREQLAEKALAQLVGGAAIHYPEELVQEYLDDIMQGLDDNLRQRGLRLEEFYKLTGRKEEDMRTEYRPMAVDRAERALVLGELVRREELVVDDSAVDAEIEVMSQLMGGDEQAGRFKQYLMSPESRLSIGSRIAADRAMDRLASIARGENPPAGMTAPVAEDTQAPAEMASDEEAQPEAEAQPSAEAAAGEPNEPESETSES